MIVATVVATYAIAGAFYGNQTAVDARWTAVFLANFHFASVGTNYLSAQQPPSPLLNFWSLAVEEQFYLVYPAVFAALAALRGWSLRSRLMAGLGVIVAGSFILSVLQTGTSPTVAYFSPLTRAWELALGALVAVGTEWLIRLPSRVAAVMTWFGLAAIAWSAVAFSGSTAYPGSLVAVPVVGAALVIAGGVGVPRHGAESLLGIGPVRYVGKLSYSLYLWHWPILIIAADAAGVVGAPFRTNMPWLLLALVVSIVTYHLIENPARHSRLFSTRRFVPIGVGIGLVTVTLLVVTAQYEIHTGPVTDASAATLASEARLGSNDALAVVERTVGAAAKIGSVPPDLTPQLGSVFFDWGGPPTQCWPSYAETLVPACTYGDPHGGRTMVLYGDSHAAMWFQAMDDIAHWAHWKLVILGKGNCPDNLLAYGNPPGYGRPGSEFAACDRWHQFALDRINRIRPDLLVMTQEFRPKPDGVNYTEAQWTEGLTSALDRVAIPKSHIVVLGNIPTLLTRGPSCLVSHPRNVQACSHSVRTPLTKFNVAEQAASSAVGARYVSATPWFCSHVCTAVIGRYEVYYDQFHITAAYSKFLEGVLAESLSLSNRS